MKPIRSLARILFIRPTHWPVWFGLLLCLVIGLIAFHRTGLRSFGFLSVRQAPAELPAGEPRLLAPCRCLGHDDLVPCGCTCHRMPRVTSAERAIAAFRLFDGLHCPFGRADRSLTVLEVRCRVRGRVFLAGYRVLCHFRDDRGESCRGLDFPFGSTAAVSCWETPARSRTLDARAFQEKALNPRLFRAFSLSHLSGGRSAP